MTFVLTLRYLLSACCYVSIQWDHPEQSVTRPQFYDSSYVRGRFLGFFSDIMDGP